MVGAAVVGGAERLQVGHVLLRQVTAVTVLERVGVQRLGLLDACGDARISVISNRILLKEVHIYGRGAGEKRE